MIIMTMIRIAGKESFVENKGLNFTLSMFVIELVGLDDPFSCNKIR
jgi:hypothetical protein